MRHKSQSVISILGLAVGFAAFVLGGYWWWWETHFDNFHPEGSRLYALTTTGLVQRATGADADLNQLHLSDLEELKKQLPEIEEVCSFSTNRLQVKIGDRQETTFGIVCDASFFSLFYADFVAGTCKGIVPDGTSIVLTESLAKQLYGTVECTGKLLTAANDRSFTIAGVIRDYPDNTEFVLQYLILDTPKPASPRVNRLPAYIRLYEGANAGKVKEKLAAYRSQADKHWTINLRTPEEVHIHCNPELTDRFRNIRILAIAGLMAFISALMNMLVLFIGNQQQKVRKNRTYIYVGGSFGSVLYKSWIELLLPMLIAYALAFCFIEMLFPYYVEYTSWNRYGIYESISRSMDRSHLYWNALGAIVVSLPLFILISYFPVRLIFKSRDRQILYYKRGLIAGQIFVGALFFVTSLTLFRQLDYILTIDRGLDYQNVIQVNMGFNNAYTNDMRVLKPELQKNPYIEEVCYTAANSNLFTEQGDWYGSFVSSAAFDSAGYDPSAWRSFMLVDQAFFSLFRLRLLQGGFPSGRNPDDLVVNETGYKSTGYTDLLNRPLYNPDNPNLSGRKVCGIIKDYLYAPLQYPVKEVYFMLHSDKWQQELPAQFLYVRYNPDHKQEVMHYIRQTIKPLDSGEVAENRKIVDLSQVVDQFNEPEKVIFTLFCLLAMVCILISTFGIYSLVSLSAEQRKKEIAIRKVNGATFIHILKIFMEEYLILTIIGNAFALPVGYVLMRHWLETYSYRIDLTPWMLLLVLLTTSAIVLFSIYVKVRKAAKENPAEAIKTE